MFQSVRSILLTWQVLLRLLVLFFLPYLLVSSIMAIAAEHINVALGGEQTEVRVGVVGLDEMPLGLVEKLKAGSKIIEISKEKLIKSSLDNDSIDIGLVCPPNFYVDSVHNGEIKAYYNTFENGPEAQEVFNLLRAYEDELIAQKVQKMGLDQTILNPIVIKTTDTFNPIVMLMKVMSQVRGALSNVLNLLFVLLILWLTRNLVLRAAFIAPRHFFANLTFIFIGTTLGMLLVFIGFQAGISTEQEGMVRSVVLSIQQLLVWDRLSSILLLWIPTWFFLIGLLGGVTAFSKRMMDAYSRTFWLVIFVQLMGVLGSIPVKKLSLLDSCVPVFNVFRTGQLSMKGSLDLTTWCIALIVTIINALLVLGIWYRQYNKKHSQI